jgi:hypothetical protein
MGLGDARRRAGDRGADAPGSQEKRLPVPWDAAAPYRGLGWRQVEVDRAPDAFALDEKPIRNLS